MRVSTRRDPARPTRPIAMMDAQPAAGGVVTVLFGAHDDGINVFARALVEHGRRRIEDRLVFHVDDEGWRGIECEALHVHLTDRIVDESRRDWHDVRQWARDRKMVVVMTLHDIPQVREGRERVQRRSESLRTIASEADLVIVCSRSEQRAAADIGIMASVVDHPIFAVSDRCDRSESSESCESTSRTTSCRDARTIVVAGFVHPGKGVGELLEALGDVRASPIRGWQLRLVGAATARHCDEPQRLASLARSVGLRFHHTGAVSDRQWTRELLAATVPVCPHLHCSASGSILSWLAHGRRPVTTDLPFSRELLSERPSSLTIVDDPAEWRDRIVQTATEVRPESADLRAWREPARSIDQLDRAIAALNARPDGREQWAPRS